MTFGHIYNDLMIRILCSGINERNERTGTTVKVLPGGCSFTVSLEDGGLPLIDLRKTFPRSAAAELAWFTQGTQNVELIRKYAPLWDKFVEEDGTTVEAAYGYRWRAHFGRDQLQLGIDALRQNPSDRRIFISAWDPGTDGLGAANQKNVPCPVGFTLNLLNGRLYSSILLRSSDLFVGLPYDVMGHALLLAAVANELGAALGTMHFTLAYAHMYEAHWYMASQGLNDKQHRDERAPRIILPAQSLSQIAAAPDAYVLEVAAEAARYPWPAFNPRPEVIA